MTAADLYLIFMRATQGAAKCESGAMCSFAELPQVARDGWEAVAEHVRTQPAEHTAWLRYVRIDGRDESRIVVCDSDEPKAFKVYRRGAK